MDRSFEEEKHHRHWKMRLFIALVMLILAFIGLIVSDLHQNGAWVYWRIMVPVFALLSIFLSSYLRWQGAFKTAITIWHELLQWFGLALAVYLISKYVTIGLMGRFEAGLAVLTLLALTIFIAGIYVEMTFVFIGLLLGFFAAAAAMLTAYTYTIMLPLTIGIAVLLIWITRKKMLQ